MNLQFNNLKFFQWISERIKTTLEIETSSVEIEERGVKLKLTVVDTPGFADSLNSSDRWKMILCRKTSMILCVTKLYPDALYVRMTV